MVDEGVPRELRYKFQIPALKALALERINRWANGQLSASQILEVMSYLTSSIPFGDRGLYEAIAEIITTNYVGLQGHPGFLPLLQSCEILSSCVATKIIECVGVRRRAEGGTLLDLD